MLRLITFSVIVTIVNSQEDCHQGTCPKHERWVDCVMSYCIPKKCDELGYPLACPAIASPCAGGCICIEGYLRNKNNVCIPQTQCPSCGGDYNAETTIDNGLHCGNLCSNYFEDQFNFEECKKRDPIYNGCKCKKGKVFNDIKGQCVDPKDCPKPCNGDHYAEEQSCPSNCQPTCDRPNVKVCDKSCNKNKCVCVNGYILDNDGKNGKCIKPENCPMDLGCNNDPNAVIVTCVPCLQNCEQKLNNTQIGCAAACLLGCTCKPGYIQSETKGKCIPKTECVQGCKGDLNAIKTDCLPCKQSCEQKINNIQISCTAVCTSGCTCKSGYIRSESKKKCVPETACGKKHAAT